MMNQIDLIELKDSAIDSGRVIASVGDKKSGAVAVFIGTTRAERNPQGQNLIALDYEASADMALSQIQQLTQQARQSWPITKIAMIHRIGRVAVGEPSVVIAVSTPH